MVHVLGQFAATRANDFDWTPWIVVWLIFGAIGAAIGAGKQMGCAGFCLGLLLGPIGIVVVAVMGPKETSKLDRIEARPEAKGWHPDPLGRFDSRWFDGQRWTQHVGRVEADGSRRQLEDLL